MNYGLTAAAVLGVLCAVLSVLFCIVMEHVGGAYRRIFKNPFVFSFSYVPANAF